MEIDKVALIRIEKGKVLMTKSFGKDKYYLPGGKREKGESDEQTLVREIAEELDVEILTDTVTYNGTFRAQADGKKKGVTVKMTCYSAQYNRQPRPRNEIEEVRWMNFGDIDLVAEVDKKIFKYLKEKGELV
ncbi:MAG: NUDIX domain-containing protein [Bacteroidota bacterium]